MRSKLYTHPVLRTIRTHGTSIIYGSYRTRSYFEHMLKATEGSTGCCTHATQNVTDSRCVCNHTKSEYHIRRHQDAHISVAWVRIPYERTVLDISRPQEKTLRPDPILLWHKSQQCILITADRHLSDSIHSPFTRSKMALLFLPIRR